MKYLPFCVELDHEIIDYLINLYYDITSDMNESEQIREVQKRLTYSNGFPLTDKDARYIVHFSIAAVGDLHEDLERQICRATRKVLIRQSCRFEIPCALCPLNNSALPCIHTLYTKLTPDEVSVIKKVMEKQHRPTTCLAKIVCGCKMERLFPCDYDSLFIFAAECSVCEPSYINPIKALLEDIYKEIASKPEQHFLLTPESDGGLGLDKKEALTLTKLFMKLGIVNTAEEIKPLLII